MGINMATIKPLDEKLVTVNTKYVLQCYKKPLFRRHRKRDPSPPVKSAQAVELLLARLIFPTPCATNREMGNPDEMDLPIFCKLHEVCPACR